VAYSFCLLFLATLVLLLEWGQQDVAWGSLLLFALLACYSIVIGISRSQVELALAAAAWLLWSLFVLSLLILAVLRNSSLASYVSTAPDGYSGALNLLTPLNTRWESLLGGPQISGTLAAIVLLYGLCEGKIWRRWSLIAVGAISVLLADARVGVIAVLAGLCMIAFRRLPALKIRYLPIISLLFILALFGLSTGYSGRLTAWKLYFQEAVWRNDWINTTNWATTCARSPTTCVPGLPDWAVDAHNSLLDLWVSYGHLSLILLLMLFTIGIMGALRSPVPSKVLSVFIPMFALSLGTSIYGFVSVQMTLLMLVYVGWLATAPLQAAEPLSKLVDRKPN